MPLELPRRHAIGAPETATEMTRILEAPLVSDQGDGLGRRVWGAEAPAGSFESLLDDPLDEPDTGIITELVEVPDRDAVCPGDRSRCEAAVGQVLPDIGHDPRQQRIG